ncbi:unnamed protein product [Adineta steineri]|uniref:Uncharacterized protein n=1 Tax=Adineta steineri TaxID=433720 RepID=A0A815MZF7_9BILA|nr:unnamed protein product [Adineta steineri]CAF3862304.1 unnamed protein product [Adineta steineri]
MKHERTWHQFSVLTDSKVLILGGSSNEIEANISELYDPISESWAITSSMRYTRVMHTSTLLKNGRVLVTRQDEARGKERNPGILESKNVYGIMKNLKES